MPHKYHIDKELLKISRILSLKSLKFSQENNYCCLPNTRAMFESYIKRLVVLLNKNNIISDSKYDFRARRSTDDAIDSLTTLIDNAMHTRQPALCVFIDLSKALDTVCNKILMEK